MTRLLLLIFFAAASLTAGAQVWAGTDIYVTNIHGIDANGDPTGYVYIDCIILPGGDTICGGIDSISLSGNTLCLYRDSAAPLCVTLTGLSDTADLQAVLTKGNTATLGFGVTGSSSIGTITPNGSAILTLSSTTKGFLIPRMTKAQKHAISNPEIGLQVFDTDRTTGNQNYIFTGNNYFGQ